MSQSLLQSTYSNPFLGGGSETPFKNFWKIVVFVLVAHILVWIVGKYGLPEFKVKKAYDDKKKNVKMFRKEGIKTKEV